MEEQKYIDLKFKKLDERAVIPSYAHEGDIGMDLTAISVEWDAKNDAYIYHTGLAFETTNGVGQYLFPRSSVYKKGCHLCNSVGVIDTATYRGEIMFVYRNDVSNVVKANMSMFYEFMSSLSENNSPRESFRRANMKRKKILSEENALENAPYQIGERVGQLVMFEFKKVNVIEAENLSDTQRGSGGFGSSDKK